MANSKKSVAQRLFVAEMAIKGTLNNPSILAAVSPFGYGQARMEEGLAADTTRWSMTLRGVGLS